MNPLMTLWPSGYTAMLALKASMHVKDTPGMAALYTELPCDGMTARALATRITDEHRRLIALTDPDPTLHAIAVLPLYDTAAADCMAMLTGALDELDIRVSLHIVGLRRDLARVLAQTPDDPDVETANIALLGRISRDGHRALSYSVISDYASGGAAFDFSLGALSSYLGLLFTALIRDYRAVLPPTFTAGDCGRNMALGMASVRFDSTGSAEYLLNRAFTDALRAAGIDVANVDSQRAADRARALLDSIAGRYRAFIDRNVMPKPDAAPAAGQSAAGAAAEGIDAEIAAVNEEIEAVLADPQLTFPEREAVMALIIGRDNPRLRGIRYDGDIRLPDDACADAAGLFVDTFNACCRPSDILPLRGDFPALRKYVTDPKTGAVSESPDNELAFDPLPDLKRLKLDILKTTELIRRKTDELDALARAESSRRETEPEPVQPPGTAARTLPDVVEQPLDEAYSPSHMVQRRRSVDLRPFFSPVRSQGRLGSCSTFATVSMYEAIMNRFSPGAPPADLSERFVYYYTNVMHRKPEGGSTYAEQLAVLGQYGVCAERLFGYSTTDLEDEPPAVAVADAAQHRVIKAMQIPLRRSADKAADLAENHRLLTSALSEGYPVGIALEIYPSFGKYGPFISRPDENDFSTGREGHHAMVLAGYSEDDKCYIVRNSWGTDFGEKGYCYISAAYVDDPDLNSFACIIAQTTESERGDGAEIPGVVAPFAGTESQIRMAAIRNLLDEARVNLDSHRALYEEYYRYYQRLLQRLSVPQVRTAIREGAEHRSAAELADIEARRESLTDDFATSIGAYAAGCRNVALTVSGIAVAALTLAWLSGYTAAWIATAAISALAAILWLNMGWNIRRRRDDLNAQIGDLAARADAISRELATKQMLFHVAGLWLDRFHELSIGLGTTYDRLVSFNNHLLSWFAEDSRAASTRPARDDKTFIYLESPALLEAFYTDRRADIVARIDLDGAFREYASGREDAGDARRRLRRSTLDAISPLFTDFSMVRFLLGERYPYLTPESIDDMMGRLISLAQTSSRDTAEMPVPPLRLIVADVDSDTRPGWTAAIDRTFPFRPSHISSTDPTAVDIITVCPTP